MIFARRPSSSPEAAIGRRRTPIADDPAARPEYENHTSPETMDQTPTVAVTAPVRLSERAIPEVVLEAGYQLGLEIADADLLPVSPVDSPETARRKVRRADGLLLTGGEDVDPRRYGQSPDGARHVSLERDEVEFAALDQAVDAELPTFGVCRGMQLLNVALGGSLWQDLGQREAEPRIEHQDRFSVDRPVHDIRVRGPDLMEGVFASPVFSPNSSHHQGVRELAGPLEPVCRAEDGLVEGVEYEPGGEGAPWIAGVQWHPERMIGEGSGTHRRLFRRFGRVIRGSA